MTNSKISVVMEVGEKSYAEKSEPCNNGLSCDQNRNQLQPADSVSQTPVLTGHNAKLYKCEQCDAAFTRPYHLVTHTRKHTGERPFVCTVCSKTFTQRSNLTTHMKLHSGEKTFQCNTCSKVFSRKYHLVRHTETHAKVYDHAMRRMGCPETIKCGTKGTNNVENCRGTPEVDSRLEKELSENADCKKEKELNIYRKSVLRLAQEPDHRKRENRLLKSQAKLQSFHGDEDAEMRKEISNKVLNDNEYSKSLVTVDEDVDNNDVKTLQCKRCGQYLSHKDFTTHFISCTCTCIEDLSTCVSCEVNANGRIA